MSVYRDKASGRYVFEYQLVIGGKRNRTRKTLPAGWTKAQAEAYGAREKARLTAKYKFGAKDEAGTIDASVQYYIEHRCPTLINGDGVQKELHRIHWMYKGKLLTQLTEVCQDFSRSELARGSAPATVRNRIRYLTAACRYAWKHGGYGDKDVDPCARVSVPSVHNERQFYLDRAQMLQAARLIYARDRRPNAAREARAVLRIGFYSGMRLAEVLRAKVVDGRFVLADSKNREPRIIPIHPRIRCCLWIYDLAKPHKKRAIQKQWSRGRDAAGLEDYVLHDVRHSAASAMANAGVPLFTIGAVLGHKDARSTARYSHLATDTLADALGTIGQKVTQQQKKKA